MFSDFKTRGFGLEDSPLEAPERLDCLLLIMALPCMGASPPAGTTPSITRRLLKKGLAADRSPPRVGPKSLLFYALMV
jgi:hypothetical protein